MTASRDRDVGGWVVELEPGTWLASWEGDPGRTLRCQYARRFSFHKTAVKGLARARKFHPFANASINPAVGALTGAFMRPECIATWSEDDGPALWWKFPIKEPPYVGTPIDHDWPEYHTHWTRIQVPPEELWPEGERT